MSIITYLVIVFILVPLALRFYLKWKRFRDLINAIPGPTRTYNIIGNIHQMETDSKKFLIQTMGMSHLYTNPKMFRFWATFVPIVVIHGAPEAEVILTSQKTINKGLFYQCFRPWVGLSLFMSYSDKWRARRKILTPAFHFDTLKDNQEVFNRQARILIQKLGAKCVPNTIVDIYPIITLCALDIICESAMGQCIGAQNSKDTDNEYVAALYKFYNLAHTRQRKPWLWFDPIWNATNYGKEQTSALRVIHGFSQSVIQKRCQMRKNAAENKNLNGYNEHNKKKKAAFLDILLDLVDQGQLPMQDVRNETDNFLFAGFDTTTASINWTLYLLGLYPDIQDKVHREIDEAFGETEMEYMTSDDLKHMAYLECCIKESMRLYPPGPILARNVAEDMDVAGYTIPAKTQVVIILYSLLRDPDYWPDPDVFDPDRFLPENSVGRHPFAYIPFSAGYRNCIGQKFAYMEDKTVLTWILRYFKVRSVHRRDENLPLGEVTLRPEKGVHVQLEMRRKLPSATL